MGLMDKVKTQPAALTGAAPLSPAIVEAQQQKAVVVAEAPYKAGDASKALLRLITTGDLSQLSTQDKIAHYAKVCEDLGLNPLTKPFDYVTIGGKTSLMANKEASAQLAQKHKVSIEVREMKFHPEINILEVWVRASTPDGRITDELGCVPLSDKVKGADAANARMKCVTKAKRRAILAHCGLGVIDDTEVETISGARVVHAAGMLGSDPLPLEADPVVVLERVAPPPAVEAAVVQPSAPKVSVKPTAEQTAKAEADVAADPDAFRWEPKEQRQRLIKEIKTRFPGISNDNVKIVAEVYKLAASWKVVLQNLDDLLAFEKSKGDSALLKGGL